MSSLIEEQAFQAWKDRQELRSKDWMPAREPSKEKYPFACPACGRVYETKHDVCPGCELYDYEAVELKER